MDGFDKSLIEQRQRRDGERAELQRRSDLYPRLVECLRDMLPYAEDFVGRSAQPFKLKAKTDAARALLAECTINTADTRQKE